MCNRKWIGWLKGVSEKYEEMEKSGEWLKFGMFLSDSVCELKEKNEDVDLFDELNKYVVVIGGWYKIEFMRFENLSDFDVVMKFCEMMGIKVSGDEVIGDKGKVCVGLNGNEVVFEDGKILI